MFSLYVFHCFNLNFISLNVVSFSRVIQGPLHVVDAAKKCAQTDVYTQIKRDHIAATFELRQRMYGHIFVVQLSHVLLP